MKIAVVGGGAAGLCTAHLLDGVHQVTVFEREPILGGNIRTLGRNVACSALPEGVIIDAGVLEFGRDNFPVFQRLMDELGVEMVRVPGTTSLGLADGRRYRTPDNMAHGHLGLLKRAAGLMRLVPLSIERSRFFRRTLHDRNHLYDHAVGHYLSGSVFSSWVRLLLMYCYSIPLEKVDNIPAAMAAPMLQHYMFGDDWTAVQGGAYCYVERILERFGGEIHVDAHVRKVRRSSAGVTLEMYTGATLDFDAIVFACTPDQVLRLLESPTDAEKRRFAAWEPNVATTVVHTDVGLYERRGIDYYSEFDVFEKTGGGGGYNAYLNRLCQIDPASRVHYGLAFNMDDEIEEEKILHRQEHHTPLFTREAMQWREEVLALNGEHHTFHAGAWLGDGLQEGAVTSAVGVSRLLNGRTL